MPGRYSEKMDAMAAAVLRTPGDLDPSFRAAIEAYAASLSGGGHSTDAIPSDLRSIVQKIALHAYKVTDREIDELKTRYSEDAIFEMMLAAALGSARARMERALAPLTGAP